MGTSFNVIEQNYGRQRQRVRLRNACAIRSALLAPQDLAFRLLNVVLVIIVFKITKARKSSTFSNQVASRFCIACCNRIHHFCDLRLLRDARGCTTETVFLLEPTISLFSWFPHSITYVYRRDKGHLAP
jgi:hypothetical protein